MQTRIMPWISEETRQAGDAIAIQALSRYPLTYRQLLVQLDQTITALQSLGIGRGDRVAIVLPNSPEMVVAFLAVSSCAVSAPLNPAYSELEFATYYSTLNIEAVIVQAGSHSPAAEQHDQVKNYSLRLIRSTFAALPPHVMLELERLFKVPVIEAYATLCPIALSTL